MQITGLRGNVVDDISVETVESNVTKYEKTLTAFPWTASENDSFEEDTSEVITARLEPNPEIYYEDVQDDDFNIVRERGASLTICDISKMCFNVK